MLVSNDKYYGILYKTEAIKNDLFIIHEFPNTFHDDIEYKTGVLSQNNNTYINNFIDRLNSPTLKKLSELDLGFKMNIWKSSIATLKISFTATIICFVFSIL